MSYRAAALQTALYSWLSQAPSLANTPIYDAFPSLNAPEDFILIGPEQVKDLSDNTSQAYEHRIEISVVSNASGFMQAKIISGSICDILSGTPPIMNNARIAWVQFERAQAHRLTAGRSRRIDLIFRFRLDL